jgi:hypothetical protein
MTLWEHPHVIIFLLFSPPFRITALLPLSEHPSIQQVYDYQTNKHCCYMCYNGINTESYPTVSHNNMYIVPLLNLQLSEKYVHTTCLTLCTIIKWLSFFRWWIGKIMVLYVHKYFMGTAVSLDRVCEFHFWLHVFLSRSIAERIGLCVCKIGV